MNTFGAQNMYSELKSVLMQKPLSLMSKVDHKKWNYEFSLDQKLIEQNYFEFKSIIQNFGTEIIELKISDENMELCDSIFTHDPSLVIKEGAIILNMGKSLRKDETKFHNNLYTSLEIPIVGKLSPNATVEGGDCVWVNEKFLLIGRSQRTNENGINELRNILNKFNIQTSVIDLPKFDNHNSCFHLMSALSVLDENLIIGYTKFLNKKFFDILDQNKIKFIEIPEDEYKISKTLIVNILALSPKNLVLMNGYPKTNELLLDKGCTLNLFNGNELCIKAEGGPTCLTRPIYRK